MPCVEAGGWTADWLVGWLAALGTVVLRPDWQLSWTDDRLPVAVLHGPSTLDEAATGLVEALPDAERMSRLSIARAHPDDKAVLSRNFGKDVFASRARIGRRTHDGFLEASVTDLVAPERDGWLHHSRFDPAAPQGITLHDRACTMRDLVEKGGPAGELAASMEGRAQRRSANGLGFDVRRLPGAITTGGVWVDAVAELLAFFALPMFPARGSAEVSVRGWLRDERDGEFVWPAWSQALDRWAIDAMLDELTNEMRSGRPPGRLTKRWSVTAVFKTRSQRPRGSNDVNRGYGSVRVV